MCLFDDNVMLFCVRDNKSERARDKRQREKKKRKVRKQKPIEKPQPRAKNLDKEIRDTGAM